MQFKKNIRSPMKNGFKNLLESTLLFDKKEIEIILNKFSASSVDAKHELVSFEKKSNFLFFVLKGCIRKYCEKDGEQITIQIITENQFAIEFISFITGQTSKNTLETLETCELLVIKKNDLEELYNLVPKMNIFIRKMLEIVLLNTGSMLNDFIMLSPEERYLKLVENNPEILNRLPQHIIASNLGISATSLSRIRKRILKSS